mmetsp:Transcript_99530/g.171322  ORF Transcript_99530/g.171322 Transcript_99530/m.171322 type:complete len:607 (-) Transcript_99530:247-2067(-)
MKHGLVLPFVYLLGFWCCFLFQPGQKLQREDDPEEIAMLRAAQVAAAMAQCPPPPAKKDKVLASKVPAQCSCETPGNSSRGMLSKGAANGGLAQYRKELTKRATKCTDPHSGDRAKGTKVPPSSVIAACALQWIARNVEAELDPTRPQILFDYAYNGMQYDLPTLTDKQWVYLTSLLPEDSLPLPERRVLADNQLLLGSPSEYRVQSLFTTNSLFDVQFALRMGDIIAATQPLEVHRLLAGMLGMGRVTYLILSCDSHESGMTDSEFVKKAVQQRLSNVGEMGLHQLDVKVEVASVFRFGGCTKELLRVSPQKIHRGVRLKWCYYPLGTKYDLIYRRGDMVQLVHRYILQWTRFGGDKVKTIRKWHPSINMGDILGWGLPRQQREVLLWDMLTQPSCPDPAIQNWLLSNRGRVVRIDPNQQSWKNKHPVARQYVEFLRLFLCVSRGEGWRQRFDGAVTSACMSCSGGNLIHVSKDREYKFFETALHKKTKDGSYHPVPLGDAVANNEYPECPACNQCVMHTWRSLKLFWHNNKSLPPPACTECYDCQRQKELGKGVSLQVGDIHGCTDVEGVEDDSVERTEFCYDNQMKPVPRPSAGPENIKKGPY